MRLKAFCSRFSKEGPIWFLHQLATFVLLSSKTPISATSYCHIAKRQYSHILAILPYDYMTSMLVDMVDSGKSNNKCNNLVKEFNWLNQVQWTFLWKLRAIRLRWHICLCIFLKFLFNYKNLHTLLQFESLLLILSLLTWHCVIANI